MSYLQIIYMCRLVSTTNVHTCQEFSTISYYIKLLHNPFEVLPIPL